VEDKKSTFSTAPLTPGPVARPSATRLSDMIFVLVLIIFVITWNYSE
jgi:hypothetical protein